MLVAGQPPLSSPSVEAFSGERFPLSTAGWTKRCPGATVAAQSGAPALLLRTKRPGARRIKGRSRDGYQSTAARRRSC